MKLNGWQPLWVVFSLVSLIAFAFAPRLAIAQGPSNAASRAIFGSETWPAKLGCVNTSKITVDQKEEMKAHPTFGEYKFEFDKNRWSVHFHACDRQGNL